MPQQKKNKLYWLDIGEGCVGIIASNIKEARKFGQQYEFYDETFEDYIGMCNALRIAKNNAADLTGFPKGEVGLEFGLKNGIYSSVYEYDCEQCGKQRTCSYVNGKIICGSCESGEPDDD